MYSCRDTYSAALLTLLLIPGTSSAVSSTATTPTSIENVGVYLAITIFTRVNIVRK